MEVKQNLSNLLRAKFFFNYLITLLETRVEQLPSRVFGSGFTAFDSYHASDASVNYGCSCDDSQVISHLCRVRCFVDQNPSYLSESKLRKFK